MTIYKRIKDTVTALDAAQMYGLNVRSNGMTNLGLPRVESCMCVKLRKEMIPCSF